MRKALVLTSLLVIFSLTMSFPFFSIANYHYSSAQSPPYARVGAYALYSGDGGFVAFLSGASANISYYVYDVYSNGTMNVFVNASLSLGTEVTNGSTSVAKNVTDSISSPSIMPAISPEYLTGGTIVFENITCTFVENSMLTVPAGNFNATEYQGKDENGTTIQFWFDRSTGLSLEMVQPASYFQLIQSNIAIPLSTQTAIQSELPFIAIFVVGWAGAGALFYAVIRHYTKKAKESADRDKLGTPAKM
jgi:hypothetical protein